MSYNFGLTPSPALAHRASRLCIATLVFVACDGDRVASPATGAIMSNATTARSAISAALPACTIHWKSAVNGLWSDAAKWDTGVVPGPTDSACLDAAGTYVVSLLSTINVGAVTVGNGTSAVTLSDSTNAVGLHTTSGVRIRAAATLASVHCGLAVYGPAGSAFTNEGSYVTRDTCASFTINVIDVDTVVNRGSIVVDEYAKLLIRNGGLFENAGTIQLNDLLTVTTYSHPIVRFTRGSVVATTPGTLGIFPASTSSDRPRVEWNGGSFTGPTGGYATLAGQVDRLILKNTSLSGNVLLSTAVNDSTTIVGDIGANIDMQLNGCDRSAFIFLRTTGGPTTVSGSLKLGNPPSTDCLAPTLSILGKGLVTKGYFATLAGSSGTVTRLLVDSLVNTGTVILDDSTEFGGTGARLRNKSSIQVLASGTLVLNPGATMIAEGSSTQYGPLVLNSAMLYGTGIVGDVSSLRGLIFPGKESGSTIGALTMQTLALDAGSGLTMEVAGTALASHDRLIVNGTVTYAGGLTIVPIAPYVGGACGDVVKLISDGSTGARGAFNKLIGFYPGPGASWRTYAPTGELNIVGYNPFMAVYLSSAANATSEGGAALSYPVCLSRAPAASVTVTPTSALSQLTFTPTAAVFPTVGWELPQSISLVATDDATIEGPAADMVTHAVTSADLSFNNALVNQFDVAVSDNDGSADMTLTVTSAPTTVASGTQFTATFDVSDLGTTLSSGSTFTILPSAAASFVSATVVSCTVQPFVGISCAIPGISSGGKVSFSITFQAASAGTWPITMSITGQQPDPNTTNDTKVKTITVN